MSSVQANIQIQKQAFCFRNLRSDEDYTYKPCVMCHQCVFFEEMKLWMAAH